MTLLAFAPRIDWLDGAVLIVYSIAMVAVGAFFARRTASAEDYHLGGRGMKSWTVGLSLFASLLSAISYLAHPEEMLQRGPMFIAGYVSYPFIILVVGWVIIPALLRARVTTAYEILGARFGFGVRTFGASIFVTLRFLWMAFVVHLLATKIIVPILGLDVGVAAAGDPSADGSSNAAVWVSAGVGLVTVVYTAMGGIRAVVATDVVQTGILFGGAVLAVALIHFDLGGFAGWWPTEWASTWDPPRLFSSDGEENARTFVWTSLSVFTWYVCTAGSDQVAIQRYLATPDVRSARRVFMVSLSADMIVTVLLGILGLALFAYFSAHPELLAPGETPRTASGNLFLKFIVEGLPSGVAGLVVAGLLAAAMSSLSSGINSVGAVLATDFLERLVGAPASETASLRRARAMSWVIGLAVVVLSLFIGQVEAGANLLEQIYRTVNLLVAPLFVLFFLALFVPWATTPGAWCGGVSAIGTAVTIAYGGIANVFWLMPVSFAVGAAVGAAVSAWTPPRERTPAD